HNRLNEAHGEVVSTSQTQRALIIDTVSQLPALSRTGSLHGLRSHFRRCAREVAHAQVALARVQGARTALASAIRSLDQFAFVCLAGYVVQAKSLSLGTFVASGLYRDQLATALSALFQTWQRYTLLKPHRLQLAEILDSEPSPGTRPAKSV